MDRQAIIDDILRTALGSNDNAAGPAAPAHQAPAAQQIVIHARQVIVVNGPLVLSDSAQAAAQTLPAPRTALFGQALRSPEANRRRLERLGPPRLHPRP